MKLTLLIQNKKQFFYVYLLQLIQKILLSGVINWDVKPYQEFIQCRFKMPCNGGLSSHNSHGFHGIFFPTNCYSTSYPIAGTVARFFLLSPQNMGRQLSVGELLLSFLNDNDICCYLCLSIFTMLFFLHPSPCTFQLNIYIGLPFSPSWHWIPFQLL